jgi:hypothetical protein
MAIINNLVAGILSWYNSTAGTHAAYKLQEPADTANAGIVKSVAQLVMKYPDATITGSVMLDDGKLVVATRYLKNITIDGRKVSLVFYDLSKGKSYSDKNMPGLISDRVVDENDKLTTKVGNIVFTDNHINGLFKGEDGFLVGKSSEDGSSWHAEERQITAETNREYLTLLKRVQEEYMKNVKPKSQTQTRKT